MRSVPRCYKQNKLGAGIGEEVVGEVVSLSEKCSSVVVSCCCEKVAGEAGENLGTQRKGQRPPLKAVNKQRLVESVTDLEH
jgi:hypothetical protein